MNIKKRTLLLTVLIIGFIFSGITSIQAQGKTDFGLGVILGEPTGISLKYKNFPVVGIAWSVNNHFHLHCDYWIYNATLAQPVNWFIGAGLKLRIMDEHSRDDNNHHDDTTAGFGIRIPVGLQFFVIPRVELFAELAPGISLYPATEFDIDGGIGARYYF